MCRERQDGNRMVVSIRRSKLKHLPHTPRLPEVAGSSVIHLPALTSTSLGSFSSVGVQVDSGLVVDQEVRCCCRP